MLCCVIVGSFFVEYDRTEVDSPFSGGVDKACGFFDPHLKKSFTFGLQPKSLEPSGVYDANEHKLHGAAG